MNVSGGDSGGGWPDRLPLLLLFVGLIGSAVLLLALTANITFFYDEWNLLLLRPGWGPDQLLAPFNEHPVVMPALIYKLSQVLFGMDSARPTQIVALGLFLTTAILFFVYVRRRVDDWIALIMTLLILFLGAAFEDLLWAFQMGYFGSLAAGIGALIALDRDDRRGDWFAAGLLVISLMFSSLALPFCCGAVVEWLMNPRDRRKRFFVPGAAIGLYGLWWIGWGHQSESSLSLVNLAATPGYVFDAIGAGFTSIAGFGTGTDTDGPNLIWGKIAFLIAAGLAAWRLHKRGSIERGLVVVLAIGLTFYVLSGLNYTDLRPPTASRYQLPSAIFILMTASWVLHGVRLRPSALIALGGIAVLMIWGGISLLVAEAEQWRQPLSRSISNTIGAVDIVGDAAQNGYELQLGFTAIPVETWLRTTGNYGSPGYDESTMVKLNPRLRAEADATMIAALGLHLDDEMQPTSSCDPLRSGKSYEVPGEITTLMNRGRHSAEVRLSRIGDEPGVPIGELEPGTSGNIRFPPDRSDRNWRISTDRRGKLVVCQ